MSAAIGLPAAVDSDALLNILYIAGAALLLALVVMMLMRRRGGDKTKSAGHPPQGPLDRMGMLQAAYDRSPIGVGFVTAEGQWLEMNKKLLAQLGYSRAEMTTVPLRFLTHPEDRKRESTLLADLRAGKRGGYSITKRLMRKNGEYRSARVHMSRIAETPQIIFQCTIDDSAQHLSQVETMAIAMTDVQETAIILSDATGIITGWNKGAERIFGYAAEEVLGTPWTKTHASETRESLTRLIATAAQNGFARSLNKRHRNDGDTVLVRSILIADLGRGDTSGFLELCHEEQAAAHVSAPVAQAPKAEEPPPPAPPSPAWRPFAGRQLPQLLTQIASQSRSGVLQLRAPEGQKRFVFEQGQLIACSSSGNDRLLGQLLVDAGVIEEEHRRAALDTQRTMGTPFGTSVVTVGPASEDDVAEVIRSNAKNEIADVSGWEKVEWAFGPDARPINDMVPIAIDVRSILAETFPQSHPAETPAAEETGGPLIARANAKKRIYHAAGCNAAKNIPRAHRLFFESPGEAEAQNFRPCNRCLPAGAQ